jgi:hypothetical protein
MEYVLLSIKAGRVNRYTVRRRLVRRLSTGENGAGEPNFPVRNKVIGATILGYCGLDRSIFGITEDLWCSRRPGFL